MGRSSKAVGALALADGEARALRERVFAGDEAAAVLRELDAHAHADSREARLRYRRDRENSAGGRGCGHADGGWCARIRV